jgi:hypothetical protein
MREIDHADDAVNHRVANSDQAIDGAQSQTIDQLLQEVFHLHLRQDTLTRQRKSVVTLSR